LVKKEKFIIVVTSQVSNYDARRTSNALWKKYFTPLFGKTL